MNWKPSPSWERQNEDDMEGFMIETEAYFEVIRDGVEVYKKNSLSQLLRQAEIDALGMSFSEKGNTVYAVDVACHEKGLNYGGKQDTVTRVAKKIMRSAMCLRGYFGSSKGEIIFASPKVQLDIITDIKTVFDELNTIVFPKIKLDYSATIIANSDFNELILKPVRNVSSNVADTSELFLRSYQLIKIFRKPSTGSKYKKRISK
ncbi:MAG: hypothetical protein LBO74_10370 [Candidatus Symbiothrix sp.]|jgi:hypothetical protein|nr:hypothetical protein [Candidatus Symbiothrix sp.]